MEHLRTHVLTQFVLVAIFLLTACTPTATSFKMEKLEPDLGPIFGTVKVLRNGEDITPSCTVCLRVQETQCIQLDENGAVLLGLQTGVARIASFSCSGVAMLSGSAWFIAAGPGKATYFGALLISWEDKNATGLTTRSILSTTSASGTRPPASDSWGKAGILAGANLLVLSLAGETVYDVGANQQVRMGVADSRNDALALPVFAPVRESALPLVTSVASFASETESGK